MVIVQFMFLLDIEKKLQVFCFVSIWYCYGNSIMAVLSIYSTDSHILILLWLYMDCFSVLHMHPYSLQCIKIRFSFLLTLLSELLPAWLGARLPWRPQAQLPWLAALPPWPAAREGAIQVRRRRPSSTRYSRLLFPCCCAKPSSCKPCFGDKKYEFIIEASCHVGSTRPSTSTVLILLM